MPFRNVPMDGWCSGPVCEGGGEVEDMVCLVRLRREVLSPTCEDGASTESPAPLWRGSASRGSKLVRAGFRLREFDIRVGAVL
jgi:hypothetical protein